MAKRKRLTPPQPGYLAEVPAAAPEMAPERAAAVSAAPVLETKAQFPGYRDGFMGAGPRRPPIAEVAGEAAAAAALSEVTESLRKAREEGRMIVALPLDAVEAGYLVRDRVAVDEEEMAVLVESLRARGQQTPIEVVALGEERYGLISGWRRLRALRRLRDETGEQRFATVQALLRRPEQSSDAYLAMVEENEIRVGLSFYERARIAAKAVELGVYPEVGAALRDLYRAASRPKRSKIRSFLTVVGALDGALGFPEAIGERLGLKLAKALETDPALAGRLRAGLAEAAPASAEAEQALLARLLAPPREPKTALIQPETPADPLPEPVQAAPGLWLASAADGSLVLRGDRVDSALRERLIAWLAAQG